MKNLAINLVLYLHTYTRNKFLSLRSRESEEKIRKNDNTIVTMEKH